jgi:bacterioferritin (cytochrome b1)
MKGEKVLSIFNHVLRKELTGIKSLFHSRKDVQELGLREAL